MNRKLQSFIGRVREGTDLLVHVCGGGYFWLSTTFLSGVYTETRLLECASRMNKYQSLSVCPLWGCILIKDGPEACTVHHACSIYEGVQGESTKTIFALSIAVFFFQASDSYKMPFIPDAHKSWKHWIFFSWLIKLKQVIFKSISWR